tara:strand:- start:2081 stop:2521 length:441 start_codon:yes stop_codon:yes gene_type:complete
MRLINYKAEHLEEMLAGDMNELARKSFGVAGDFAETLDVPGLAFTAVDNGHLVASGGVQPLWNGVGEGWFVQSGFFPKKKISIIKLIKENFDDIINENSFFRVQAGVRSDWRQGVRFAEYFGFQHEGIMRKYGPDGQDYHRMARIK